MALHSTTASMPGVRIPKLKVRNRPPDAESENYFSHSTHPSVATYATSSSGHETVGTGAPYSPQPSSPGSPASPVFPSRVSNAAPQVRPPENDNAPKDFRFPAPGTAPQKGDELGTQGDMDVIQPLPSPTGVSTDQSHLNDAHPGSHPSYGRNLVSRGSSAGGVWSPPAKKKGKLTGVFGFLSVQEPSAVALEQFAQSQRKLAAMRNARDAPVGMSSVTDRKLPDYVPKVNSKWDGLPDWASEALKEAKKSGKGKQDALLHRMADNRRPDSQHNSVSTFGSQGSNGEELTRKQATSRPRQRSDSAQPSPQTNSVLRLRNPSRGREASARRRDRTSRSSQQRSAQSLAHSTAGSSKSPSDLVRHTQTTGTSEGQLTAPVGNELRPTPAHKRSTSDPRLNFGMDNVATITAFLGDEDVSVQRIAAQPLAPLSSERLAAAPPPIPRKSSKRQPPRSTTDAIAVHAVLGRSSSAETAESIRAAEHSALLDAFPTPPSSPRPGDGARLTPRSRMSTEHMAKHRGPHVHAIYPPDPNTLAAAVLSSSTVPSSEITASHDGDRGIPSARDAGSVEPERAHPKVSKAEVQQGDGLPDLTSVASSELREEGHDTGLGSVNTHSVKESGVPWERRDDAANGAGPPPTCSSGQYDGRKKGRWSMLRKIGGR